jgi:membrane associated rhomboid family serine protease
VVSVVASGAIFGLFGANMIYLGKAFGGSITSALIYVFFLLFLTTGVEVNSLVHFGGLAAGLLIGYALAKRRKSYL